MIIYSIGHSNHEIVRFLELIGIAGIQIVVDIRSQPYSQFAPQFNRETLKKVLNNAGLKYEYAGDELGGRPTGDQYYDSAGRVLYGEYRFSEPFRRGIDRLRTIAESVIPAILCSEENPAVCHRKLLVGRYLLEQGDEVLHIRGDGSIQNDRDVGLSGEAGGESQMTLFDTQETLEWKSIRSVLPGKAPKNFSEN